MNHDLTKLDAALSEYEKETPVSDDAGLIRALETLIAREIAKGGDGDEELVARATDELIMLRGEDPDLLADEADAIGEDHLRLTRKVISAEHRRKAARLRRIIPVAAAAAVLVAALTVALVLGVNRPRTVAGTSEKPVGKTDAKDEVYFPEQGNMGFMGMLIVNDDYADSISELYGKSDMVILGTVTSDVAQYKESGPAVALSGVKVEKVWKGDAEIGETLLVSETGWRLSDGTSLSVGGEPVLGEGMRVILFLGINYNGTRTVMNDFQGKYFLDGEDQVYSYKYYSDLFGSDSFDEVGEKMSFDDFEALLKDSSLREGRPAATLSSGEISPARAF